jgi:hypothetical protein
MAIYPYTNTYVINKDAVAGAQFKAGMVLMMNADGKAVPADSQLLVFNSLGQKLAKILGLAAGDSNLTGNTIIVPDTVGNNYLDENKNFVNASNAEYVAIKRQLLDYADETINEYYNMNFSPIPKRRGIGVYCLTGDTFATDQFSAVLHGDYGIDDTDLITFSPGDLLTFGGGVNAGKLVKVNTNSVGPDVIVVGTVEKYNSAVGLLYFKNTNYILRFSSASLIMSLDAGNSLSYSDSSSILANDLTLNNNDGTLTNGVGYDAAGGGSWAFDGTNDFISLGTRPALDGYQLPITLSGWFYLNSISANKVVCGFSGGNIYNFLRIDGATFRFFLSIDGVLYPGINLGQYQYFDYSTSLTANRWYNFAVVVGGTLTSPSLTMYVNNVPQTFSPVNLKSSVVLNQDYRIGANLMSSENFNGLISQFRIYNRVLSASEILAYYNATKSRYGL